MQKKILLPLITAMILPFLLRAEWIPIGKQNTSPTPPTVTLISDDNSNTVIKIEISGFELKDLISGDKHYQVIDLLSEHLGVNEARFSETLKKCKKRLIPAIEKLIKSRGRTLKTLRLSKLKYQDSKSAADSILDPEQPSSPFPKLKRAFA